MQKEVPLKNDVEKAVEEYADMIFRVCIVILKNEADAQDAVQETFLKYIQKAPRFESGQHEKAWLIKVATNYSRNVLKRKNRYSDTDLERITENAFSEEASSVLDALRSLPEKYSIVVALHYIDGYKVNEIAEMIGKTPSAVKMRLHKGRKLLEKVYREE
ncbi:MAG: sigma-70 family RNA polymerase sigma factor [Clostridia bacterium]|nr:sigma-70 family RNA polymerase sigma factor [Clostridia bacterium]